MYYIKLSTSYLTRRVKVAGRGKKTFADDKMLDQNVRSTFRAIAATWRLSILGRTPPGNFNVTWWSWNLKKAFNECILKDKGNNFNHERRWPTTVAPERHFPTSILYVCVYQKRKEEKVKKIHGTDLLFSFFLVCGRRFRDNREGDFRRSPDLLGTLPHGPSWTLEILETFVLGPS